MSNSVSRPRARDARAVDIDDLWSTFIGTGSILVREALFRHYVPYARALAAQLFAGRLRDDVEFGDFLQLALVGLLEALDRFDPQRGIAFETYCTPRIRGSVLDGVGRLTDGQEQMSFMRRAQRERLASIKDGAQTGDAATDTFRQIAHLAAGLAIGYMLDGSGMLATEEESAPPASSPWQGIAWRQTQSRLSGAVAELPVRYRRIIHYHYFCGLHFEQIADILGTSRARISQLHHAALAQLKDALGERQRLYMKG